MKLHEYTTLILGNHNDENGENCSPKNILLTLADMRTNLARVTAESIRQNYGRMVKVYQTVIPVGVKAAETSAAGQSIYSYDKNSTVAKAYASFTREVVRDGERQRNKAEPSRSR